MIRQMSSFVCCVAFLLASSAGCTVETGARVEPEAEPEDTGPGSTVVGRVTDELGPRPQAYGGEGTAASTTSVRAVALDETGVLVEIGRAVVEFGGAFTLALPSNTSFVVIEALDDDEVVLASALLESTSRSLRERTCTPLNTESTLEANVWLALRQYWRVPADEISIGDLRARLDAHLAEAVRNKVLAVSAESTTEDIRILARAVFFAQKTRAATYASAAVADTWADIVRDELDASQVLSRALYVASRPDDAYDAHTAFHEALRATQERRVLDAAVASDAASAAGFAFRAVVVRQLRDTESSAAILDRAVAAAARAEGQARPHVRGFVGEDVVVDPIWEVTGTLFRSLSLAMTAASVETAWRNYRLGILNEREESAATVVRSIYDLTPYQDAYPALLDELANVALSLDVLDRRLDTVAQRVANQEFAPAEEAEEVAGAFLGFRANAQAFLLRLPDEGPARERIVPLVIEAKTAFWDAAP